MDEKKYLNNNVSRHNFRNSEQQIEINFSPYWLFFNLFMSVIIKFKKKIYILFRALQEKKTYKIKKKYMGSNEWRRKKKWGK